MALEFTQDIRMRELSLSEIEQVSGAIDWCNVAGDGFVGFSTALFAGFGGLAGVPGGVGGVLVGAIIGGTFGATYGS